jgi:hypothetical protein
MRTAIWLGLVACGDSSEQAPAPRQPEPPTPAAELAGSWGGSCQPPAELSEEVQVLGLRLELWELEPGLVEGDGIITSEGQSSDEGAVLLVSGSVDESRAFELQLELDPEYATIVWWSTLAGQLQDDVLTAQLAIGPFEGVPERLTLSCALERD